MSEAPLYSLNYIKELSSGNDEFVAEMIGIFIMQTPEILSSLKQAYNDCEYEKVKFYSHKLKSSISIFEINTLQDKLILTEKAAIENPSQEILKPLVNTIVNTCEQVMTGLKAELSVMTK
jgi:HPt (histidine-containing phosphotransfer) domain-containing protein